MKVWKTREFARFAHREDIQDAHLRQAIERAQSGLVDADLGGGLIKQRIARRGQGRRGGYRTLVVFRAGQRTMFLYGFAKNERDNIGGNELRFWRRVAEAFLTMDAATSDALVEAGEIMEVDTDASGTLSQRPA